MPALERQQREQARSLDRLVDGLDIDSLAALGFHGADEIRGLVASEAVRSAALVTVPLCSTLAISLDDDGGQLSVLAPPEVPPNVKKAIEVVAGLVRDTPDYQQLILAILLLWARKYGSIAWREYCMALLPPFRELSCLLCYTPGELSTLQLPHMVEEAARQHDWARWAHSQWLSSASGALRRLGLADSPEDTMWALAVVRSRAVEFHVGATTRSGSGFGGSPGSNSRTQRPPGPVVSVLAPVVDLANHSNDPNCVIQLTTDRSRVVLLPRRPVAAGEPLTVDYGFDRSSLELMADYGFVTSANPYDGELALPGADKLPPLELPRLQAAARSLLRRRQRQAALAAAGEAPQRAVVGRGAGEEGGDDEEGGGLEGAEMLASGIGVEEPDDGREADAEDEEESCFGSRLRAAVQLLAPRTAPLSSGGGGGSYSTPATQRIIAGLWHKLVRHCADSLPTSLESDGALLEDVLAGRLSGFTAGPALSLDPASLTAPPAALAPASPPMSSPTAATSTTRARPGLTADADASRVRGASRQAEGQVGGAGDGPGAFAAAAAAGRAAGREGLHGAGGAAERASVDGTGSSGSERHSAAVSGQPPQVSAGGSAAVNKVGHHQATWEAAASSTAPTCGSQVHRQVAAGEMQHGPGGAAPAAAEGWADTARGGLHDGAGGGEGQRPPASAAAPAAAAAPPGGGVCRSGRRAGRLHVALRARVEHKQLLAVAEELLLQYARN